MKRLAFILVLLLATTALSQSQCPEFLGNQTTPLDWENILGPETLFGDPVCLLRETQAFLGNTTGIGLFSIVDRFANVLFLVFTGIALVNLAARNSLELSLWFLAKLFIVGMIFGLSTEIRDLTKNTWYSTYEFSDNVWHMPGGVSEQLKSAVDEAEILFPTTFGLVGIVKTGGRKLLVTTATEGIESQMGRQARKLLNWAPTLLNFMLYAFLPVIFIYGALIYLSGIQMLVFLVFFKLAAAFLMLPFGGLGMMRRLVGVYVAALLKVLWLPFMFAILIDLTLRQPMRRFNGHLQAGLDSVNTAVADLNTRMPGSLSEALSPREWQDWLNSIPSTVMASLGGILTIIIGWILGFVMMLVLLGVGIWLMQQTSGFITALVGGFGGSGAVPNPLAKAAQLVQHCVSANRSTNPRDVSSGPLIHIPPSGGSSQKELEQPNKTPQPKQNATKGANP
jgi:hypothetical protein